MKTTKYWLILDGDWNKWLALWFGAGGAGIGNVGGCDVCIGVSVTRF